MQIQSQLMTSDDQFNQLFSRTYLLGESRPPTKRANLLLFHIESRTAHLMAQSQIATQKFLAVEATPERDLAFIDAFHVGATAPQIPTVEDIERFAPQWAALVPDDNALKAAVAHQLGLKYRFAAATVPQLRAALGLDASLVQAAYQRFYPSALADIYVDALSPRERLAWAWNWVGTWLENLPPFWAVFSLTFTEVVGASILALPIALAQIGPLPSLLLLFIFGLMNVLTVGYMAETAARSADIRYGNAFLSQVVHDYLGRAAALILSIGLFALILLVLLAFYIGFATAIAAPTRIPAPIWVALLFGAGLYYVTRGSLKATVTSSLVVGAINLSLLVILMLLTAPHINVANLAYFNVPFFGGRPFDPSILKLIFGIILAAYFGHLSVPNSARAILQRDPSGAALVHGAMAAQATAILFNSIWILVVNGAIAPDVMAAETGTPLAPLAAKVGPIVYLFGTIFVILGMGMITIHFALGLFNLTREWLPQRQPPTLLLHRRQARLHLHPSQGSSLFGAPRGAAALPQMGFVYLGLEEAHPRFRLDIQTSTARRHIEVAISTKWDSHQWLAQASTLGSEAKLLELTVEVLEANAQWARVQLTTSLAVQYEPGLDGVGLTMSDLLLLVGSEARPWVTQAQLFIWMMRKAMREERVSLEAAAQQLAQTPEAARVLLVDLAQQGIIQEVEVNGVLYYEPRLAPTRTRRLPSSLVKAMTGKAPAANAAAQQTPHASAFQRLLDTLFSERGRFVLGLTPLVLVFFAAEILLMTGAQSFSGPLSFIGVVVIAMLGGIYPVLLLHAGRQKGEIVPGVVYRLIGNRVLLVLIYLIALLGLILHGLVIWHDPVQRLLALLVAAVIVAVTIHSWWQGAFAPRLVVNLRAQQGRDKPAHLSLTKAGQPHAADIQLTYRDEAQLLQPANQDIPNFAALQQLTIDFHAGVAQELKIWAYVLSPDGTAIPLPALAKSRTGTETVEIDLNLTSGQVLLPLGNQPTQLTLTFPQTTQSAK